MLRETLSSVVLLSCQEKQTNKQTLRKKVSLNLFVSSKKYFNY